MYDIVEALRATPETGADPDVIFRAADEIERLRDAIYEALAQLDEDDGLAVELREALKAPNVVAQGRAACGASLGAQC